MSDLSITNFVPQTTDSEKNLLQRLLAAIEAKHAKTTGTALASAARTATTQSSDIATGPATGILVYINVTAASGSGGISVRLRGKDPVSSSYAAIGDSATYTTTGIRCIGFAPGMASVTPGLTVNGGIGTPLPDTIRLDVQHADASSYTYTVGYCLVP
jgi:hypothetical protein